MKFDERHQKVGDRPIFPNTCLSWMMLNIDERDRVLADNDLYCKYCLRLLRAGRTGNSCGIGRHTNNTGYNGMCSVKECDRHVTLCKKHESDNRKRHKIYRQSLEWANSFKPEKEQTSLLMIMAEESESRGEKELDDINDARRQIHLKRGADTSDIFGYVRNHEPEKVALAVIEDRRENLAQFDLAYIDVNGHEILAAFDSCSSTTLIERELSENEKIQFERTDEESKIAGIGGTTDGAVVSLVLTSRNGRQIRINASIVEEIATIRKKDSERFEMLIKESADAVRRIKGYKNVKEENFQRVPGGRIQMLLGLDIGRDFFPKEISTYKCGLQISEHRMKLFDERRYLGFSGSFPAHFKTMYSPKSHPRALLVQSAQNRWKKKRGRFFGKLPLLRT